MKVHHEKLHILNLPTPLQYMPTLSKELGVNLYFKRDDLTDLALGGNKLRKLEYLLYDAIQKGATVVYTCGAPQTNHGRQTAAICAKMGIKCCVVTVGDYPGELTGNMLLCRILGARLIVSPRNKEKYPLMDDQFRAIMEAEAAKDRERGDVPYIIPLGGSVPIGMMGYYECACELIDQCREQKIENPTIVSAAGSLGTYMGLLLGLKNEGAKNIRVIGGTDGIMSEEKINGIRNRLNEVKPILGITCEDFTDDEIYVTNDFNAGAYNTLSPEIRALVMKVARAEGIFLDPTYTGKSFNALCGLVKNGTIAQGSNVIFIHSGGIPGIFTPHHRQAFADDLMDGVEVRKLGDD